MEHVKEIGEIRNICRKLKPAPHNAMGGSGNNANSYHSRAIGSVNNDEIKYQTFRLDC